MRRVQRAVDWACGLCCQVLAHVDEAAVTLARHVLIEPAPPREPCCCVVLLCGTVTRAATVCREWAAEACSCALRNSALTHSHSCAVKRLASSAAEPGSLPAQGSSGRRVLAAALFVAVVEGAWQAHVRCSSPCQSLVSIQLQVLCSFSQPVPASLSTLLLA